MKRDIGWPKSRQVDSSSTPSIYRMTQRGNLGQLLTKGAFRPGEWMIECMLVLAGMCSIVFISLIFLFLFKEAFQFFKTVAPMDLIGKWVYDDYEEKWVYKMMWQAISEVPKYSLLPLLCGSFLVAFPSTVISAVFGIGCGVYLSEIASERTREILKPALELFAGIPSVVIGFFMLMVAATPIQDFFHTKYRMNAFVGALGVTVVAFPIIVTLVEDSLRAVPKALREASYALGATKWQTIWRTTMPAAISGVSAACILGFGRALGETMIVVMVTGNAALVTGNVFSSVRSMTANIAAEMGYVEHQSEHYFALFLVGAVLFVVTFILNIFSEITLNKMRRNLRM